jgi:hypothetical protein
MGLQRDPQPLAELVKQTKPDIEIKILEMNERLKL